MIAPFIMLNISISVTDIWQDSVKGVGTFSRWLLLFADEEIIMQPNEMEAAEAGPLSAAQALPACDICDKVFKSVTDVKKHRIVHFPGKYVCSTCGKNFKTPGNRNVHERQVHSVPKYPCKHCDKQYKSEITLKSHIRKMHAAEEDTLERQEEDPDLTLEAPEGGEGEEMRSTWSPRRCRK